MKALFLDRDGVVNIDKKHAFRKEDIEFIDGIFEICKHAYFKNYKVFIITNQAGIAKGYYTERDFIQLSWWMKSIFLENACPIVKIFYSPFHMEAVVEKYRKDSVYRKPNPGMILKARNRYSIDLKSSILIGDHYTDILAGLNAGVKTNLLFTKDKIEQSKWKEEFTIRSLHDVYRFI